MAKVETFPQNFVPVKSLNSCRFLNRPEGILLKCFKNLCKSCPKDRSNLRLSVNLRSDMDEMGKIQWVKVPYMSAPEALNLVKGIRLLVPNPKIWCPGTELYRICRGPTLVLFAVVTCFFKAD